MDGEVVEDQVVDRLERRAADPAVVPVDADVAGLNVADQPGAHRLAHPGEMRRPAAVLVDGEDDALLVGEIGEPRRRRRGRARRAFATAHACRASSAVSISGSRSAGCGVRSTTAMSSRRQRALRYRPSPRRCGKYSSRRASALASVRLQITATSKPARPIGVEMRGRNAARADQRDPRPIVLRHRRPVGQLGRRDFGGGRALQAVGVEVRRLAHATSGTVRFVCGRQHGAVDDPLPDEAERRVERPGDRRAVLDAGEHVFDRRAPARRQRVHRHLRQRRRLPRLHGDVIVVVVARDRAVACRPARSRISAAAAASTDR